MHQGHTTEEQSDIHIALYDRHISALLPYLARLMTSHQDVENVLFDVFAAALTSQAFTRLTHEQQRAWLYRVARNKAIDHYRHHTALTIVPLDETRDSQDEEPTPEQRFLRQERYTFLREAIAQLTPLQQQLIHLRYQENLRLVEIATHLQKPDGTVRKMLARTLKQLRTLYERQEKGGRP
ncbi:RNA polymerase sigma factor [Ktedonobacter racemifer]|uniref:RNA polymerase, sigma-24 subunit, ECF subfamily n=1 Tax=Ktedonobacter racemifer DSM 44963 TaxID=485913 RepID=D6U7R6_KTERA|nr:RNA polymerase sigma factor [Ktedonobacter racemifer]EFH79927.1 RNA polymerase, sigma-24 subunit, ECF subfamily [Ktedonobacter racemifer DSM 44963]